MQVISGLRKPIVIKSEQFGRMRGFESFDLLLNGKVVVVKSAKRSEKLGQLTAYALLQDEATGVAIHVYGRNEFAPLVAKLKLDSAVSFTGQLGRFNGQPKFTVTGVWDESTTRVANEDEALDSTDDTLANDMLEFAGTDRESSGFDPGM